ncbi:D-3-phosphoglycerate dehydrogenase / 2-oxoglutarate reductase [Myxococcaceae bacterium]|jgi:phosphoglycerate dehydrogenase-like enzyme|nr:D-3-phosphoglycerate dehydrogenase / 2-oxoglutarate reductase [Myxococcaceae bacterium]
MAGGVRPAIVMAMAPVLTADLFDDGLRARLARAGDLLDREPLARFDEPRADALLARVEVLLTSWGCPLLDEAFLARAPKLRAIVHAAGTVKQHVGAACFARGIAVSSAAAANAIPVAEFSLAAILLANKRVFRLRERYREVKGFRFWAKECPGLGNYEKTVGIVGASHIGRRVLDLLRSFELERLLYDPLVDEAEASRLGARKIELDDLLRESDVVSLHAPALAETHHLLDARRLALLRDGATLVNTARGWLVDHEALERELASGRIDAVIDTTDPEILPPGSRLYELPNVFLTPHIAGSMGTETRRMARLAVEEIERLARGEALVHAVRGEDLSRVA